jgi:hypothetical protein
MAPMSTPSPFTPIIRPAGNGVTVGGAYTSGSVQYSAGVTVGRHGVQGAGVGIRFSL